ncbi:MAG: HAD family hydrolase [Faecousia sp.]
MRYESLILDIDGTLWDSRALVAQGYNLQLEKEGLNRYFVDAEWLKPLFGKVMTEIADNMFPDLPESERYALMDRCMERENRLLHENECAIGYPGIAEALSCLAKNHRLFIVSNSQCGYPELCIGKLGLKPYITGHLCFGDTGTDKGTTIRTLMEKFNISSAAYVGDTEGDRQAAEKAGIDFLWAAYGFGKVTSYTEKLDSPMDLIKLNKEGRL